MKENQITEFINDLFQDRNISGNSRHWANWESELSITKCKMCAENHGMIVDISVLENKVTVNAHPSCKCIYVPMRTKIAGTATDMGYDGADAQILYLKKLPSYYVSKIQAGRAGWKDWKGNLSDVLPGKIIGGDVFKNREGKLPYDSGRIWYEADINYYKGYRNKERLLYSSDGLMFVTYDHYQTFYEIIE